MPEVMVAMALCESDDISAMAPAPTATVRAVRKVRRRCAVRTCQAVRMLSSQSSMARSLRDCVVGARREHADRVALLHAGGDLHHLLVLVADGHVHQLVLGVRHELAQ